MKTECLENQILIQVSILSKIVVDEYGLADYVTTSQPVTRKNYGINPDSRGDSPSSIDQMMRQTYLETHRDTRRTVGGTRSSKRPQNNIQVKGKASIKNLIRVAATRK